jgi:hypothetical protein
MNGISLSIQGWHKPFCLATILAVGLKSVNADTNFFLHRFALDPMCHPTVFQQLFRCQWNDSTSSRCSVRSGRQIRLLGRAKVLNDDFESVLRSRYPRVHAQAA